jgi:hypothetical protein
MSWKLTKCHPPKLITRKLATEFAALESPRNDRPLSERRLQIYERIMRKGEFRPTVTWARANCAETNDLYRVNGKHTSTLLSSIEPMPDIHVIIEDYECDTMEDVARLYATFDSRLQIRNSNDVYRSFAAVVPELAELPSKIVNVTISGLAYHKWLENYSGVQAVERAELILDECEFALLVSELVGSNKHLTRVPVVAAMYGSWKKAQGKAKEFWEAVRDETGPKPNTPDRRLAKFLILNSVNSGRGAEHGKLFSRKASPREFYVKCIHAWNAWRRGENTDLKFYKDAKVPAFV